jgi:hypothetical protein
MGEPHEILLQGREELRDGFYPKRLELVLRINVAFLTGVGTDVNDPSRTPQEPLHRAAVNDSPAAEHSL